MSVRTVRLCVCLFVCFLALRPPRTAKIMSDLKVIINMESCHTRTALLRISRKNAERRDKHGTNATNAVATLWHRQHTPLEILERQGSAFRLDILKQLPSLTVMIGAPYERPGNAVATRLELHQRAMSSAGTQ